MALLTNINGKFSVSDAGAVTFNNAFTFPTTDGTANYVLQTNGSGQISWAVNGSGDISGSGTANKVTKFTGAKTIGNGPITFATNDSTFAGSVTATHYSSSSTTANIFLGSVITKPGDNLGFIVRNDSNAIIGSLLRTSNTASKLTADTLDLSGTTAQYVRGDGSFATYSPGTGTVTGSGTANTMPVWTSASALGDSIITTGSPAGQATVGGVLNVTGNSNFQGSVDVLGVDDIRVRFLKTTTFKAGLQVPTTAGDMITNSAVDDFCIRSQTNILFATGGATEKMRITSAGNVGIGTTSPSSFSGFTNLSLKAGSTGNNLDFYNSAGTRIGALVTDGNDDVILETSGLSRNLIFKTDSAGTFSEKMRLTSGGDLCVGVTSALGRIHMHNSGTSYLHISNDTTGSGAGSGTDIGIFTGQSDLQINNREAASVIISTSDTPRLTINSSGNVGIGTTNPTNYKLEVNGNVKGDSFGNDQNTTARIFAPSGAAYNGSGAQTGYLIMQLPDNGAGGVNNMMSGVIRVFDYASGESFDVHFAGYWYSGYNWTNCTAFVINQPGVERNFNVRFGAFTGSAGANTRPYIAIGEATSTWSYCKFSVIEYTSGHSNMNLYKWNSGWGASLSATLPGAVLRTVTNTQTNNWKRSGSDMYNANSGNVGIGTTSTDRTLDVRGSGLSIYGTGNNTELMLRGQVEGTGTVRNVGAFHWSIRGDVGGDNDDLKLVRFVTGTYSGIAMQVQNSTGDIFFGNTIVNPASGFSNQRGLGYDNSTGNLEVASTSGTAMTIGRNEASDGQILQLRKESNIKHSFGSTTSYLLGNVGIGKTSPTLKLDVSSNGTVARFQSSGSYSDILFQSSAGSNFVNFGNVNQFLLYQGGGGGANVTTKIDISGNAVFKGDVVAYGSPSDIRLKENIKPIESALEKVSKLNGVTFDWKEKVEDLDKEGNPINLQQWKHDIGFIAQDVQKVIPELVRENDNGMLSMRHQGIAPILLEAIKELKAEIEELKSNKCNCNK